MGKAEWGGNPVCWWSGLYFCSVCLDEASCTECSWWLGDAGSYIQVVSNVWVLTIWYSLRLVLWQSRVSESVLPLQRLRTWSLCQVLYSTEDVKCWGSPEDHCPWTWSRSSVSHQDTDPQNLSPDTWHEQGHWYEGYETAENQDSKRQSGNLSVDPFVSPHPRAVQHPPQELTLPTQFQTPKGETWSLCIHLVPATFTELFELE